MIAAQDLVCTCLRMDVHERLDAWRRRALPVLRRWLLKGHRIDAAAMQLTVGLVARMDHGPEVAPEAFSADNWARSHHVPGCPCSGRRTPLAKVPRG